MPTSVGERAEISTKESTSNITIRFFFNLFLTKNPNIFQLTAVGAECFTPLGRRDIDCALHNFYFTLLSI